MASCGGICRLQPRQVPPDHLGHGDAAAPLADVLVAGEQRRLDPGGQRRRAGRRGPRCARPNSASRLHEPLELLLGPRLLLVEPLLERPRWSGRSPRPAAVRSLVCSPSDSLVFLAMSISRESAAYSRGVRISARRPSHFFTLSRSGRRWSAPGCASPARCRPAGPARPRQALRASSTPASISARRRGTRLGLGLDLGQLDVDLLQLLQRLQLLTQRQGRLLGWRPPRVSGPTRTRTWIEPVMSRTLCH